MKPVPVKRGIGLSHGRIGLLVFMGAETIFFATFLGAYLVLKMGAAQWPPAGTPLLTRSLSTLNTAILLVSSGIYGLFQMSRIRNQIGSPLLIATILLGAIFVGFQIVEFSHLYGRGLTLKTGAYGALFFCLVGCHGFHVLAGLVLLAALFFKIQKRDNERSGPDAAEWIGHGAIYWHFVALVWVVLYSVLYW